MKNDDVIEEKEGLFAHEQYTLTLKHEFVDRFGRRKEISEPIKSVQIVLADDRYGMPAGMIINQMMEQMKHYVLHMAEKW
jgi:hypothetical protein